uniref:HNH endonuclease n=1 Tax=Polynucleobacter sp. TaxID=2029855 RepID=UPI0040475805
SKVGLVMGHLSFVQDKEMTQNSEHYLSISESDRESTEKEQLIKSRVGQGVFRQRVFQKESACRVTGVSDERFLIASHIKPWRVANDHERLDGSNGLLLSPHIDRLFDGGWISFHNNGDMLVSDAAANLLKAWDISLSLNVGRFTDQQSIYLAYHRREIYRGHQY